MQAVHYAPVHCRLPAADALRSKGIGVARGAYGRAAELAGQRGLAVCMLAGVE